MCKISFFFVLQFVFTQFYSSSQLMFLEVAAEKTDLGLRAMFAAAVCC